MTQSPQITGSSWLMVLTLGFVWGGTFLINELALEGMTPFWLAAGRIGFGALLSIVIWQLRGGALFAAPLSRPDLRSLILIGLLSSALPFSLISWGQQFVTAGFTGVSMASVGLMVLPLAHFLVPGERITLRRGIGFLIGFIGVALLIGASGFESTGLALEFPGRLACFSAAACYAFSSVMMRRLPAVDPLGLSAILLVIGAAVVIPMAWVVEGPPPLPDTRTLLLVAFLGMVPTAAANLLRVAVIRTAGPVFMSLTNYQVPVWSVVLGAAMLGEPLPPVLFWSMALILCGVALSQYGALRRLFGKET